MSAITVCMPYGRSTVAILEDVRRFITSERDEVKTIHLILSPQDDPAAVALEFQGSCLVGRSALRISDGEDMLYVLNGGTTAAQWEIAKAWTEWKIDCHDHCEACGVPCGATEPKRVRIVNLQRDGVTVLEEWPRQQIGVSR